MNRLERFVLTAVVVFLPVVTVIAVLIWSLTQGADFLVGGGSTSVVPMMNDFLQFYRHDKKGYSDMLYNAIGSSASLAGIRHGSYQFGFLSKTVDDKLAQQLWTENQVFRFVVARDPVMIIYNIGDRKPLKGPDVFTEPGDDTGQHLIFGNYSVSETQNNARSLSNVMQQFYVHHKAWTKVFSDRQNLPSKRPTVISREAGSGTREFFEKSILKSDKYEADQYVGSNQLMLDAVASTDNSIGYLSFEYAKSILSESKSKYSKVVVAAVTFKSGSNPQLPWKPWKTGDKDKVNGNIGYALYRPFTGIFRTTGRNADEILRFVAWMINPYTKKDESGSNNGNAVDIIRQHGLFPVFPGDSDHYFQKYNDWSWRGKVASAFQLIQKNSIYKGHHIPGNYECKIPSQ